MEPYSQKRGLLAISILKCPKPFLQAVFFGCPCNQCDVDEQHGSHSHSTDRDAHAPSLDLKVASFCVRLEAGCRHYQLCSWFDAETIRAAMLYSEYFWNR